MGTMTVGTGLMKLHVIGVNKHINKIHGIHFKKSKIKLIQKLITNYKFKYLDLYHIVYIYAQ